MSQEPVHSNSAINEFLETNEAFLIALFSTLIAQFMNLHLSFQHYHFNTNGQQPSRIISILNTLSIYGLCILKQPEKYSDTFEYVVYEYGIRQFYGAYVIYNYLMLCDAHFGGEENVKSEIHGHPVTAPLINRTPTRIYTFEFQQFYKVIILQFWMTKAVLALGVGILKWWYHYRENDWSDFGYILVTVLSNISAALALCALTLYTSAVRNIIKPDPTLKFFVVTALVFLAYWQGVVLAILENVGLTASATDASGQPLVGRASTNLQNFLVLVESSVAAIALRFAFPAPADQRTPTIIMTRATSQTMLI